MSGIRESIKKLLLKKDIIISRPPGQFNIGHIKLARIKNRGLDVKLAIDGGAAEGDWAREFKEIYPQAQVLCIEPRENAQPSLESLKCQFPGIHIARTLLGPKEDLAEFNESGAQSSVLPNSTGGHFGDVKKIEMTPLDALIEKMNLPLPDLIKLDLQGYELQALEGATRCLAHAEAVLLECSFIPFQKDAPLLADVVGFMEARGFRLYDVLALWHRPLDGAMAQGDLMFISKRSKLVSDNRWSAEAAWA